MATPAPDEAAPALRLLRKEIEAAVARQAALAKSPPPPPPSGMDETWRTSVEVRLAELKEAVSSVKMLVTISMVAIGLLGASMIGHANHLSNRMDRLETKLDALPARLDAIGDRNQAAIVGLATAIASGITAARTPAPVPEAPAKP